MGNPLGAVALLVIVLSASFVKASTLARIEAKFELAQVTGNPFDFTANDVRVALTAPDGTTISLPAFFDGGTTWRVRHAPTVAGKWSIKSVTLNGKDASPTSIEPHEFTVTDQTARYVRIDSKDKMRFALDDGTPYYPVGYDLAWHHTGEPKMGPLTESLAKMKAAGVNWTRIWMNAWDGKNLDWAEKPMPQPKLGELSLEAAKQWDAIVDAAEAGDVRFQMVLQHHGQYSTTADSNWLINPWNTANGGFLADPTQFFTDEKARTLTRAKFRYIVARWGYSPSIMAWELFNEVQFTDAFKTKINDVAAWHAEMAKFIREQDAYHHLITTSSDSGQPKLWPAMDYYQDHVYAPDLATAVQTLDAKHFDKPYFFGEVGSNAFGAQVEVSDTIHTALWASLMTGASGAAEYWFWYEAEPRGLLYHYTAAQNFIRAAKLLERRSTLKPIEVIADTGSLGALHFGPGISWAPSTTTSFAVHRSGKVEGVGGMSAYLQGAGDNHAMFPFAEFAVDYAQPGTFSMRFDEMTPDGATVNLSLDGKPVSKLTLPALPPPATMPGQPRAERKNPRLDAAIEIPVPEGKHLLRIENTGGGWVHLREFTLSPYAAELAVLGKGTNDYAVMWCYRRAPGDKPIRATLKVPGLDAGQYKVAWWDTEKGTPLREETATVERGRPLTLSAGAIATDVAVYITR